ncbi:MAG: hypothetical protein PHX21_12850 [bacterium]|nr:hypothetical protein [bacterium]
MAYLVKSIIVDKKKPQVLTQATDKIPHQYYQYLADATSGSVYRTQDRKRAFFVAKRPFPVYETRTLTEVKRLSSGRYIFLRDKFINGKNYCLIAI